MRDIFLKVCLKSREYTYVCPPSAVIYHCDLTKEPLQPHIFREVTVKGFNPSDYQTTQVSPSVLPSILLQPLYPSAGPHKPNQTSYLVS